VFYDRFIKLCKNRNVKPTPLIVKLGLSSSNAAQWKKGSTPRPQVIQLFADYFEISPMYFYEDDDASAVVYCYECGLQYNSCDDQDCLDHTARHAAWESAKEKFGFCWEVRYREDRKINARAIISDPHSTLSAKIEAQIIVLMALFSRSLEASGYSLDHPCFDDYAAMILNQGIEKHGIPATVYSRLVEIYGKKPGIPKGTYFLATAIPEKEKPLVNDDKELTEYLEILKTRPEMRMLFQLSKDATKEDVEATVRIIEALRNK